MFDFPVMQTKITRIRQKTAQRLKESQNTCAALTTFQECDMRLIAWLFTLMFFQECILIFNNLYMYYC